ncbi:hypothetical protein [Leucobacter sp. OH1287]|uniref:hypothetical protein n=1 Tax=Leucobacter sp. OH1287 TaxID=2491049 RepID=UPI000F5FEF93|nr:hypothetical protein [Leucobacter sp. OH1287]RRD61624.1 hypothetical protein EII30_02010 [Leucobacter sp. OH1287]
MGYNLGTNDPFAVERRRREDAARAAREAVTATGTETFQAVRKLQEQVNSLADFVARLPSNVGAQVNETNFSVTDANVWKSVASTQIVTPPNKSRVVVQAVANATVIAHGVAAGLESEVEARLLINGVAGEPVRGSISLFARTYGSNAQLAFVREIAPLAGNVAVELQLKGTRFNAYPSSNTAALSVMAGFSTV